MLNQNDYCVILAGGIGSRLWPCSRRCLPKQFMDFLGSGYSLLQSTYNRFIQMMPADHIFVATNVRYVDLVKKQLPNLNDANICVEPMQRNTAPVLAWVSQHIAKVNPEANIIISPSDQLILNEPEFARSVERGLNFVAQHGALLTMGVKPTRPDTGYGYIQMSDEMVDGVFSKVRSFTEKPEIDFANLFVNSGEFFWNTGLFLWNVKTILQSIHELMPEMKHLLDSDQLTMENYSSCPNMSIDYGILERSSNVYVQICDFGWADLGTWSALYAAMPKDVDGNVVINSTVQRDNCHNNIIKMPKGKVAVLQDLEGYVVADEGNVLIVCKRDDLAELRKSQTDIQMELGDAYV